jgi:hypothetical protein
MPSSYTPSLRLVLPVQDELTGTWGNTVNNGLTSLVDAAIAGTATVSMPNSNYTLTAVNEGVDEARRMFIRLTGTLSAQRNVVCPAVSKLYFVSNETTGGFGINFKTSSGTGVVVPNGARMMLYCNGTNVVESITRFSGTLVNGAYVNVGNIFTVAQTFQAANAIRVEAAATQDAIVLAGRAGGTGSFAVTMTPATLAASRTYTLPDAGGAATFVMTAGAQTLTGPKRGQITANANLSFDMSAGNNFSRTTSGAATLTFTNITAGQSGFIKLVNAANHTISAAATTKIATASLTAISATGTYILSYFSDGTNVYVSASGDLT